MLWCAWHAWANNGNIYSEFSTSLLKFVLEKKFKGTVVTTDHEIKDRLWWLYLQDYRHSLIKANSINSQLQLEELQHLMHELSFETVISESLEKVSVSKNPKL